MCHLAATDQPPHSTNLFAIYLVAPDETPKPTVALDLSYGRKPGTSANGRPRDGGLAHFYELGGNSSSLAELVSIVVTPQRLPTNTAVLVLDLGRPCTIVPTAVKWAAVLRSRATECLEKLAKAGKGGPSPADQLTQVGRRG